jgi:hypothetical protein
MASRSLVFFVAAEPIHQRPPFSLDLALLSECALPVLISHSTSTVLPVRITIAA